MASTHRKSVFAPLFLLLFIGSLLDSCWCQDDDAPAEAEPEKACWQYLLSTNMNLLPIIPKCLFGPNNAINLKLNSIFQAGPRFYCVVKCVLAELEILDSGGILDESNALIFFQDSFPEYALPAISEAGQPCLAMASEFKPEQYYCQSYSKFVQCLMGTLVTAIGPFALDCYGTPFFSGLFGLLNFVVPPERVSPEESKRRRRIMTAIKSTVATSGTLTERIKQRREQVRVRFEKEEEEARRRLIAPANITNTTTSTKKVVAAPGLEFLLNNASNFQFHTNDTESVTYQLDRVANFMKSLQMILNATGTVY